MGPCMKRLLLLAAFERTSQMAESDFFAASPRHECPLLEHATPRTHCQAARGPSLLDVLWLVPPPSGGGTVRAIPLPLNPLWPHMVFHSRFFGNAELEGCGLPMLPLIWFRIPHCQPSSKPSGFKVPNFEYNGTFLGILAYLLSVRH